MKEVEAGSSVRSPWRDSDIAPVTVAIATFNRSHFLAAALRSCSDQIVRPERVIVVDDGSTDGTEQVVRDFTSLDIDYVNVGKIGLGNARNLATALCRSKYICVLDDDDIMLPVRLRDHMVGFDQGAQLSHGGWINFNTQRELQYWPGKHVDEDLMVYVGAAITHGACCYETALLREFPYRTDVQGGADFDLALRVVRSDIKCQHTFSYVLLRRRHQASMSELYSSGQENMRHALVGIVNLARDDREIAQRTAAGRLRHEVANMLAPTLAEIYTLLGSPTEPMRVIGSVPRSAEGLFALLGKLNVDWSRIDIVEAECASASTVGLACRPTTDLAFLTAFEAALREHFIKPAVLAVRARPFRPAGHSHFGTATGSFRIAINSTNLREVALAHAVLRHQRDWEWYVVIRETPGAQTQRMYGLVSAPFRKAGVSGGQETDPEEVRRFVHQQTDLPATLIHGANAS